MKSVVSSIVIGLLACFVFSCQKTSFVVPASVTIIHAMPDGNPIIPVMGSGAPLYFNSINGVSYGGSVQLSAPGGTVPLAIYQYTDTTFPIIQEHLALDQGQIYSLFIAGDTTHPDTLFIRDVVMNYEDSSAGVRFVNLSTGAKAITVNLLGNDASQTEFPALAYKTVTPFKKYPANSTVPGFYTFEIRDQASGDVLSTVTWNYTMNKNNTVVISGSSDLSGPFPLYVFQVNNF